MFNKFALKSLLAIKVNHVTELNEFKAVTSAEHMSGLYISRSIADVYR